MKRDYPDRPIVGVGVVVIKGDQVLLVRRSKPPVANAWSIPGGAQELEEGVKDAARREVREETAVTVAELHLLDVIDYMDQDARGATIHHYTLVDFAARYLSGAICPGDDAERACWAPLDRLVEYNLWHETENVIRKAAQFLKDAP